MVPPLAVVDMRRRIDPAGKFTYVNELNAWVPIKDVDSSKVKSMVGAAIIVGCQMGTHAFSAVSGD